ncbi:hypothetical protein [Streptomyces sp. NPDC059256]|uniref:hypothetical protein n=1 Tax=Streptomyces sp. NPDC059256 TaxID=3346794 RepID=UPI003682722B
MPRAVGGSGAVHLVGGEQFWRVVGVTPNGDVRRVGGPALSLSSVPRARRPAEGAEHALPQGIGRRAAHDPAAHVHLSFAGQEPRRA